VLNYQPPNAGGKD